MRISSNITLKLNEAALKQLTRAAELALGGTAEALKTEVVNAQVVPFDSGETQRSMDVDQSKATIGEVSITVNTPYARRIYFHPEYNFQKTNNAQARGKWFEEWLPGGAFEKFAPQAFSKLYKKYSGGVIK